MKNLFLLPTDKPSRLSILNSGKLNFGAEIMSSSNSKPQHIYITNDEEIKEGDWFLFPLFKEGYKIKKYNSEKHFAQEPCISLANLKAKKIILTTNNQLIKDGVQAIDDEFLEWFVKNPTCEVVETKLVEFDVDMGLGDSCVEHGSYYKIIIPQEELKPIHKFNSGLGATLCGECYVIISEGLTEELFCEKCKHKQKLNSLVESWQKRQKECEDLAEKHRDSDHTYKKYTYRAQATRDCWKELLKLIEDEKRNT